MPSKLMGAEAEDGQEATGMVRSMRITSYLGGRQQDLSLGCEEKGRIEEDPGFLGSCLEPQDLIPL